MTVFEQERQQELKDIEAQLGTAQGRRFLNRMLSECGVYQATFSMDHAAMSFQEGKRNLGIKILADIMEVSPKKYMVMMLEAKEERERLKQRIDKESEGMNE